MSGPPPVRAGGRLPAAKINLHGEVVNLREFFQHRTGVIFGLTGAFAPQCTKKHAPAIRDAADDIRRHVDFVGCILVNDPFVVKAWAKKLGIGDQFTFIADSFGEFTRALGLGQTLKEYGFGYRCRRFAMIVGPVGRIQWIGFKDDASPARVLEELPKRIRAPWKFLVVGMEKYEQLPQLTGCSDVIATMNSFIASDRNGFSEESDWQLCLSDTQTDAFRPTRDNVMNGLRWLAEGAQGGDSLFLYIAGHTLTFEDPTNPDPLPVLLPLDYDNTNPVSAEFMASIIENLPPTCRLTIVFDSHLSGPALALPYVAYAGSTEFEDTPHCPFRFGDREVMMFGTIPVNPATEDSLMVGQLSQDLVGCLGMSMVTALTEADTMSYGELLEHLQRRMGSQIVVTIQSTKKFALNKEFTVVEPIL